MKLNLGAFAMALACLFQVPALAQQYVFPNSGGYDAYPAAPAAYAQGMEAPNAYGPEGCSDGSCGAGGCGSGGCGDGWGAPACTARTWFTIEYLQWYTEGRQIPALVTTSPLGTAQNVTGHLGQPTTTVLFGDDRLSDDSVGGGRVTAGLWLDSCQQVALTGTYWELEGDQISFSADSPASAQTGLVNLILARPFFDATNGNAPAAALIAYSDTTDPQNPLAINEGSIDINGELAIRNAEANLMLLWGRDCLGPGRGYRLDLLGGYRFSRIEDVLTIDTFSRVLELGGINPVGTTLEVNDTFRTENEFHGGQIGLSGEYYRGRWTYTAVGKFAVGNMHQVSAISGQTTTITPGIGGTTTVIDQGLLALDPNSGIRSQDRAVVIPELNLNLNYRITDHMDFTVGYSLVYWNLVALAGNQIDLTINPTLITPFPAPPFDRPRAEFVNDELWAQGVNVGCNFRW